MEPANKPDVVRRRFRIVGRVQGIGFRMWTVQQARELELIGTVRNHGDGSVEVEAAGPAHAVDRLHHLLRKGPPLAVVQTVQELEPGTAPLPDSFHVV